MSIRRLAVEAFEKRELLAVITVNTTADSDGPGGAPGTLSLRQAIELSDGALSLSALGSSRAGLVVGGASSPNTIDFAIAGNGPFVIAPNSALPVVTRPTIINGYSQPGAHPNTNGPGRGDDATLRIEVRVDLDVSDDPGYQGALVIEGGDSVVEGLAIGGYPRSSDSNPIGSGVIVLEGAGGDAVRGCFVGLTVSGTPETGDYSYQVYRTNKINVESDSDTIGGTTAADRNVVAGDQIHGVVLYGRGDLVEGNFLGTDPTGARSLGENDGANVVVLGTSDTVGGTVAAARNILADQADTQVQVSGSGDLVEGNYVGIDVTGTEGLNDEGSADVTVLGASDTIGGTVAGARNVIASTVRGVELSGAGDLVEGNDIGTNATGTGVLGLQFGVEISGTRDTVGGTAAAARNLISGCDEDGVAIIGTGDLVEGNYIGTDVTGTRALADGSGVYVLATSDTIGGTSAGARNLISGNTLYGIVVGSYFAYGDPDQVTDRIVIEGNDIGTDATGTRALGNGTGVYVLETSDTIGGTSAGAGNVISGNRQDGIDVGSEDAFQSQAPARILIAGNFVGTDITGTRALGNSRDGIDDVGSASDTIGGTSAAARNVVSGNGDYGIELDGGSEQRVEGNDIGTDITGTRALGNAGGVSFGANSSTLGGTSAAARNVISANGTRGVLLAGNDDLVEGDFIGTDAAARPLGNHGDGVDLGGQSDTIGGTSAAARNVISANQGDGIAESSSPAENRIEGNSIGTDPTGTIPLGNRGDGVALTGQSDTIGGTAPGAGNVIADNERDGVVVSLSYQADYEYEQTGSDDGFPVYSYVQVGYDINAGSGQAEAIARDSVFGNGGLGIDLLDDDASFARAEPGSKFATPKVPAGAPGGGNDLQPAPLIVARSVGKGVTTVRGTVAGAASTRLTIEVFANPPGGKQGQTYLGSTVATTDPSGHASFSLPVGSNIAGMSLTATATDAAGDTSEFSAPYTLPRLSTSVTLTVPAGPVVAGVPIILEATVTTAAGVGAAGGSVAFLDDGQSIGSAPLDPAGRAYLAFVPPGGAVSLWASYGGSPSALPSSSAASALIASKLATATTLVGPSTLVTLGQPVTYTARVTASGPGTPTGMVVFASDGVYLGEAAVDPSGVATLVATASALGPHEVASAYLGDGSDAPSWSNLYPVGVLAAPSDDGPTVTSVQVSSSTTLTLTFSRPLSLGSAGDSANYSLVSTSDGRRVGVVSASYDPRDVSVTLTLGQYLEPGRVYQLEVDGTRSGRLVGVDGRALDGAGDGKPGSDYVGLVVVTG